MSSSYEHPSLALQVTVEQRERAEQWLQQAYADGRLTEEEFDRRIGTVLSASTRRELNQAFYGLVHTPSPSALMASPTSYPPAPRATGTGVAALAHFSALFTWIIGPGVVYALSTPGTIARRESAKAFNFQLITALAFVAAGILTAVVPGDWLDWLFPLLWFGWLLLTIIGGAKALSGQDWRNPVKSVIKLDVLPER